VMQQCIRGFESLSVRHLTTSYVKEFLLLRSRVRILRFSI